MPIFDSGYPKNTNPDGDDYVLTTDTSDSSAVKGVSLTSIKNWLAGLSKWVTSSMIADEAVTGAKITSTDGLLRNTYYYTYDGTDILINGVSQNNGANTITWNKPSGLKFIEVTVVGGGGGGGGTAATNSSQQASAGGGGGGGAAVKKIDADDLSATETITVGAKGAGGSAGSNNGSTGGTSSFGSHCSGTGGTGGSGGSASSTATVASSGSGGTGTGGDANLPGARGGVGMVLEGIRIYTGGGGGSYFATGVNQASPSQTGANYGGGGAGAIVGTSSSATAGGDGAPGIVIVKEYF